jgi:hypothetical protein
MALNNEARELMAVQFAAGSINNQIASFSEAESTVYEIIRNMMQDESSLLAKLPPEEDIKAIIAATTVMDTIRRCQIRMSKIGSV